MRSLHALRTAGFAGILCLCALAQNPPAAAPAEKKGLPARDAPSDYQAHAAAGAVTIGAESLGHSIPRPADEGEPLTTDDYVVIETGLFGAPGTHLKISYDDFSLRINEMKKKKPPLTCQPFGATFRSLKDPDWEAQADLEVKKEKDSASGNGINKTGTTDPPVRPHMPIELQRKMQQHVQKVALPEGDRALPEAGLIFFPYHGKVESIHSMQLIYAGPAGTATLELQP